MTVFSVVANGKILVDEMAQLSNGRTGTVTSCVNCAGNSWRVRIEVPAPDAKRSEGDTIPFP